MWQYCQHCKMYIYKLGMTCPLCMSMGLWNMPLPDKTMQKRLNTLWNSTSNAEKPVMGVAYPLEERRAMTQPFIAYSVFAIPERCLEEKKS